MDGDTFYVRRGERPYIEDFKAHARIYRRGADGSDTVAGEGIASTEAEARGLAEAMAAALASRGEGGAHVLRMIRERLAAIDGEAADLLRRVREQTARMAALEGEGAVVPMDGNLAWTEHVLDGAVAELEWARGRAHDLRLEQSKLAAILREAQGGEGE